MTPILELAALRMVYDTGTGLLARLAGRSAPAVVAVDDVNLRLAPGSTLALVGESGSGKTTTGRIATLQERPTGGAVFYGGREVTDLKGAALKTYRRDVQMIFQNPYEALDPRLTVGQSLAEPLELHLKQSAAERRALVLATLEAVELPPAAAFAASYPANLSGGQLQRIAIARALITRPKVVIADEPVSMLDVSIRSGVMNLMLDLQRQMGVSYLYITHDLAVARYMSDRIAVMYLGAVMEEGPTETLVAHAGHPYTRLLISAVPDRHASGRRDRIRLKSDPASQGKVPSGCRFHPRCPLSQPVCATTPPPVVELAPGHSAACHFAPAVARDGLAAVHA